jgi:hypothetical protein
VPELAVLGPHDGLARALLRSGRLFLDERRHVRRRSPARSCMCVCGSACAVMRKLINDDGG